MTKMRASSFVIKKTQKEVMTNSKSAQKRESRHRSLLRSKASRLMTQMVTCVPLPAMPGAGGREGLVIIKLKYSFA